MKVFYRGYVYRYYVYMYKERDSLNVLNTANFSRHVKGLGPGAYVSLGGLSSALLLGGSSLFSFRLFQVQVRLNNPGLLFFSSKPIFRSEPHSPCHDRASLRNFYSAGLSAHILHTLKRDYHFRPSSRFAWSSASVSALVSGAVRRASFITWEVEIETRL